MVAEREAWFLDNESELNDWAVGQKTKMPLVGALTKALPSWIDCDAPDDVVFDHDNMVLRFFVDVTLRILFCVIFPPYFFFP